MGLWSIVVVCHLRDLGMLRLQARSLARYMPAAIVGRILVIENDSDSDQFAAAFVETIMPEYGALQTRVRLVRREFLAPGIGFSHGWRSQQVLKMLAARLVTEDRILILDAKNHFTRPVDADSYQAPDGRLRFFEVSQRGHLAHMFHNSFAAFGLDPEQFIDHALPNITPFPARSASMIGMVEAIERSHGMSFAEFFLKNDVAEFYLLSAFITRRDGGLAQEYAFGEMNVVTVFPDKADIGTFQWVDYQMRQETTLCFGVHWAALALLSPEVKQRIAAFWLERGLVRDVAEGLEFLAVSGSDQASGSAATGR